MFIQYISSEIVNCTMKPIIMWFHDNSASDLQWEEKFQTLLCLIYMDTVTKRRLI
jgi:hypothetical protein